MKLLGRYKNGNYWVDIFDDGTKIRHNKENALIPNTIESFDLKITNKCHHGCPMCHENSTPEGKNGDILNVSFLNNLHPYTEIAIGGGNPLEHPDLVKFLDFCKEKKFIPSMTIHMEDFLKKFNLIKILIQEKLIYGLGVSYDKHTFTTNKVDFLNKIKQIPSAVIHIINGLISVDELSELAFQDLKILILGYKHVRRGELLYQNEKAKKDILKKQNQLYTTLEGIINEGWFEVVSFDNLALKQLDVQDLMSKETWDEFYMGDDGIDGNQTSASMFIDLVEKKFAKNSCDMSRYDLLDTVEEMYSFLLKQ